MIIETTDNRFYVVRETGNPNLSHVWLGVQVKWDKKAGMWAKKPNRKGSGNRPQLISKAHCLNIHVVGDTCDI